MGNEGLISRRVSAANCPEGKRGPSGALGAAQSDPQGAMRHRTPRARGQPLRAVCSRNVIRLFRPFRPELDDPKFLRVVQPFGSRRPKLGPRGSACPVGTTAVGSSATGRPEQIQEPGTAVPGTPIFANNAKRGGPPLESPCRWLSFAHFSFRHRKKSVSAPWNGKFHSRAVVGASGLLTGNCFRQSCRVMPLAGGFPLAPCRLPKQNCTP